jgi:hypothetical protein
MPYSWMRVQNAISPKVRACMGGDLSKRKFADCVGKVVEDDGGRVESLWFEQNGRFARVHVEWANHDQKAKIVFDLEATDVIDLFTPLEIDMYIEVREQEEREAGD